jgi:hypothetical protein
VTHSENGCRGAYKARVFPQDQFLRFSQRTCPIHYFRSKTHVWADFAQFRCCTSPIPKTCVGVHTSTSFCHRNHFFIFRNEHAQSTTLGPKPMFGVVSRNFDAARHPFRKRVSGCIQARVFATGTISSFFATNMANPLLLVQNSCLGWFRAISLSHVTPSENGFLPPDQFLRFSQRTCPTHYFRSKTHVWGGFAQFRCRTSPILKTGVGVHTMHEFLPPEPFLRFFATNMPNPLL